MLLLRRVSPGEAEKRPLVVIKLDIINRVADKTGVPKMKAEQAVEALFHSMKEALTRGERIELRGFGVFVVKPRKRGVGRNPRTGEEVAIPSARRFVSSRAKIFRRMTTARRILTSTIQATTTIFRICQQRVYSRLELERHEHPDSSLSAS